LVGDLLRLLHEGRELLSVEPEKDARSLHLGALAVRGFDLQRGARFREDRPDAECAVFFEQDLLHAATGLAFNAQSTRSGMCSGKDCTVWSPPGITVWQAPA